MLTKILTSALSIETKYYLHVPCINKLRMKETEKQIASPLNNKAMCGSKFWC